MWTASTSILSGMLRLSTLWPIFFSWLHLAVLIIMVTSTKLSLMPVLLSSQRLDPRVLPCAKVFPERDPLPFALMAWSIVHGIAKLAVSGHLSSKKEDVLDFTSKATAALIRGLKLRAGVQA